MINWDYVKTLETADKLNNSGKITLGYQELQVSYKLEYAPSYYSRNKTT